MSVNKVARLFLKRPVICIGYEETPPSNVSRRKRWGVLFPGELASGTCFLQWQASCEGGHGAGGGVVLGNFTTLPDFGFIDVKNP